MDAILERNLLRILSKVETCDSLRHSGGEDKLRIRTFTTGNLFNSSDLVARVNWL
jgi:hypothetical protein